ncbi:MAG: glycosyltransferase family 2 protein [Candidatus Bathyarchaeaceae archaeon]
MTNEFFDEKRKNNCNGTQLSLVLPVHNEAEAIGRIINELYDEVARKVKTEIIVREGGSTDGTKEVLLKLSQSINMKPILQEEKGGYMRDVKDGLRQVYTDYVLFIDSDGQYSASDFWKLYEKRDKYDMIIGYKIKRADPLHRIVLSKVFHTMTRALFKLPLHDPDCGYRIIKKKVIDSVVEEVKYLEYSFWSEFTIRAFKKGFKLLEVPIQHRRRLSGNTKLYTLTKLPKIIVLQLVGLFKLWKELRTQGT